MDEYELEVILDKNILKKKIYKSLKETNITLIIEKISKNLSKHNLASILLKTNKKVVGFVFGFFNGNNSSFTISCLYILKDFRSKETILFLIESILNYAYKTKGIKEFMWNYDLIDLENDPFVKIIQFFSNYEIVDTEIYKNFIIRTADFNKMQEYEPYNSNTLLNKLYDKGYKISKWADCEQKVDLSIATRNPLYEEEIGHLNVYFQDIESLNFVDKNNSYILFDKKTNEVVGWVICEKAQNKYIKILSLFVYKKEKKAFLGSLIAMYFLKKISMNFDVLGFDINIKNNKFETFINKVFKDSVEYTCSTKKIKLCFD